MGAARRDVEHTKNRLLLAGTGTLGHVWYAVAAFLSQNNRPFKHNLWNTRCRAIDKDVEINSKWYRFKQDNFIVSDNA